MYDGVMQPGGTKRTLTGVFTVLCLLIALVAGSTHHKPDHEPPGHANTTTSTAAESTTTMMDETTTTMMDDTTTMMDMTTTTMMDETTTTMRMTTTSSMATTTTTMPTTTTSMMRTTTSTMGSTPTTSGNVENELGLFIIKCEPSHLAQVDPIVAPGRTSMHMHQFFGNTSTNADSTLESMLAADTTCSLATDTAGYWAPSLIDPQGRVVEPSHMFAYYRNRPLNYGETVPFPTDFRLIAGGVGSDDPFLWKCFGESQEFSTPPVCNQNELEFKVHFPNCWDGVRTDSADHRSHVVQPVSGKCPSSHPVKLPDLRFSLLYGTNQGGPGYVFSDGETIPHVDFWNTWDQPDFERLVRECLNGEVICGKVG